jgi:hypothetical protein
MKDAFEFVKSEEGKRGNTSFDAVIWRFITRLHSISLEDGIRSGFK